MAGVVPLVVALLMGVAFYIASKDHHRVMGDQEVYRYPTVLVRTLAAMIPIYGLLGTVVLLRQDGRQHGTGLLIAVIIVFGMAVLANALAYLYYRSFSLIIGEDTIAVDAWGRRRAIAIEDIRELNIRRGKKGLAALSVIGQNGAKFVGIGSSIQDFEDLVVTLQDRAKQCGASMLIRERDPAGDWHNI